MPNEKGNGWLSPIRVLGAMAGIILLLASTLSSIAWTRLDGHDDRIRAVETEAATQRERDAAILQRLDRQDRADDAILERLDRIDARLSRNP